MYWFHLTPLLLGSTIWCHRITKSTPQNGPKFSDSEENPSRTALSLNKMAADRFSYPFMALVTDTKTQCGGCLITYNVVVTAAHCLERDNKYNEAKFKVILHRYHLNSSLEDEDAMEFKITRSFVNENYTVGENESSPHDVAVLIIDNEQTKIKGVDLNNLVELDQGKFSVDGEGGRLLGWGSMSQDIIDAENQKEAPKSSKVLKEMNLRLVNGSACNYEEFNPEFNLCARGNSMGDIPCKGDSGGPLVHLPESGGPNAKYSLVGLVSFGNPTCTDNVVFAKVATYLDFINDKIESFSPKYTSSQSHYSSIDQSGLNPKSDEKPWSRDHISHLSSPIRSPIIVKPSRSPRHPSPNSPKFNTESNSRPHPTRVTADPPPRHPKPITSTSITTDDDRARNNSNNPIIGSSTDSSPSPENSASPWELQNFEAALASLVKDSDRSVPPSHPHRPSSPLSLPHRPPPPADDHPELLEAEIESDLQDTLTDL